MQRRSGIGVLGKGIVVEVVGILHGAVDDGSRGGGHGGILRPRHGYSRWPTMTSGSCALLEAGQAQGGRGASGASDASDACLLACCRSLNQPMYYACCCLVVANRQPRMSCVRVSQVRTMAVRCEARPRAGMAYGDWRDDVVRRGGR